MALSNSSELKKRARLAKQRLKMGYRDDLGASRGDIGSGSSARLAAGYGQTDYADEQLYQRVCNILDEDATTINPIGQLIDNDLYYSLDPSSRQRYILELSNKFRELKERYVREHERTGS